MQRGKKYIQNYFASKTMQEYRTKFKKGDVLIVYNKDCNEIVANGTRVFMNIIKFDNIRKMHLVNMESEIYPFWIKSKNLYSIEEYRNIIISKLLK